MKKQNIYSRVAKLLLLALFIMPASANAVTTNYTLNGNVYAFLDPTAGSTAVQSDVIVAGLSSGTASYDSLTNLLSLTLNFAGDIYDTSSGPDIGNINGTITYGYDNVLESTLGGNQYLLAITDNNNNGSPAADGQGNGVSLLSMSLQINGNPVQNIVSDIEAKSAPFTGSEPYFGLYNPVSSFLQGAGEGAYFALGNLAGYPGSTAHAWYMTAPIQLNLGAGRTGLYTITLDLHGNVSSTPPTPPTNIPEPASLVLLGSSLLGLPRVLKRQA